jgi:hypothetical protein
MNNQQGIWENRRAPVRHFPGMQKGIRMHINFGNLARHTDRKIRTERKPGEVGNAAFTPNGAPPLGCQIRPQRRDGIIPQNNCLF